MYESPISIIETATKTIMEQRENTIVAKVQDAIDVQVDKGELLRALQYDRGQYDKGYKDGKRDALDAIVHCKDCKHYIKSMMWCMHGDGMDTPDKMDFCSCGERRDNERKAD